jgi:hypothetical protein
MTDDEAGAWKDVVIPQWKTVWKPEWRNIFNIVNNSSNLTQENKARYSKSLNTIGNMFMTDRGDKTFYKKFQGGTLNDTYILILPLSGSRVERIKINTDFE